MQMNRINFQYLKMEFTFPIKEEPRWKTEVDRWYQLDPFSYALTHFYSESELNHFKKPSMIILASPAASNETDRSFVETGASSPGKFVHTLPNVRCSPLCQVMKWTGPVLCLQKDPSTQISAIQEAAWFLDEKNQDIWVLSVRGKSNHFVAEAFVLGMNESKTNAHHKMSLLKQTHQTQHLLSKITDVGLWKWLSSTQNNSLTFKLGSDWSIERNPLHE